MSKKAIRNISNQAGTLSDGKGTETQVRFSLTQWQEVIDDEIPSLKSTRGHIEFKDLHKEFFFTNSLGPHTLRGGGIEASIILNRPPEFKVTGPLKDLK